MGDDMLAWEQVSRLGTGARNTLIGRNPNACGSLHFNIANALVAS